MNANDLQLIFAIITLLVQAGKTMIDMVPEVTALFQVLTGTPLTDDQRAELQARHDTLTEAALRPLTEPTAEEREG